MGGLQKSAKERRGEERGPQHFACTATLAERPRRRGPASTKGEKGELLRAVAKIPGLLLRNLI